MNKTIITLSLSTLLCSANFMDSVGDLVESTLKDDTKSGSKVNSVKTLATHQIVHKENTSILDTVVDGVKSTMGLKEKETKNHSIVDKSLTVIEEVSGLKNVKKDHKLFKGGLIGDMADMIGLEEGDSFGLPSVFGLNKKHDTKVLGSTLLGDTLLGDVKETTTTFYRGFRNTGKSTEFMSGMMYKSSKIYNGMFKIFDESPLNVFDDKKSRGNSVFDMFDAGNEVLDIVK